MERENISGKCQRVPRHREFRIYKQMKLGVVGDQKFGPFRQSGRYGIVGFIQLQKNLFDRFSNVLFGLKV